jgi:hypothetical protein
MQKSITIALLCISVTLVQPALAQHASVSVDAGTIIESVHPWLYGINTARWDESLFPGRTDDALLSADRDAIAKIRASGITLLKYPGGNDADHYVWNSPSNNSTEMDTDEYIALCRAVGAEPFITVNFNESPELAAAWVRYCNISKAYNVKLWEVGDEQWGTWARGHVPPEEYARKYIRFVDAMRSVDPTIKVATNVPLGAHPENWAHRVLKAAPNHVDMLTFTYFPQQWGKENDDTLLATVGTFRQLYHQLRKDVEASVGPARASTLMYVNVGYNSVNHSPGPQTLQMVNALWTADMLGAMAEMGTDIACFWALHNFYPPRAGDFGYLSSEGKNTPRSSYYVFPLLRRHIWGNVCKVSNANPELSVYAGLEGKRLSILLINKSKLRPLTTNVSIHGFAPQPNGRAWVVDDKRKILPVTDKRDFSSSFPISVPPYAILALELISQDSVVPAQNLAQFATATASSYSTIGPHFGPSSAIDGVADTRWNSAAWTKSNGDEQQWFQLSWKNSRRIARIQIAWGESPAVEYSVKSSSDGKTWKTLLSFSKGMGGIETHAVAPTSLRFLRIEGIKGTKGISAYSIREIRVFEK